MKATAKKKQIFKYKPRWGVIVLCRDEAHHKEVFNDLKKAGHKVRPVSV